MFGILTNIGAHWQAVGKGRTFQDWDKWARKGVLPYNLRVLNTDFDTDEAQDEPLPRRQRERFVVPDAALFRPAWATRATGQ